jgi:hypothetical protein
MNPVLDKIQCIYECQMFDEPTNKPGRTTKKRLATSTLNPDFERDLKDNEQTFIVTGKIDGTCCRITNTLQKRRDLKKGRKNPENWEKTGATVGFMPLEKGDKHHNSTLKEDTIAIVHPKKSIIYEPLVNLQNTTVELVGPKIQGNPHGLPQYCVIVHGSIQMTGYPTDFDLDSLKGWFENDEQCEFFEGIVVHFSGGNMYKVHRHHLDMAVPKYRSLMEIV